MHARAPFGSDTHVRNPHRCRELPRERRVLAWSLALATSLVLSARPAASGVPQRGGSPAAPTQADAESEKGGKDKDPVYEEGYTDGFEEGKSSGKAGRRLGPDSVILPSGLIQIMIQRLGLSKYRRWEQGYLMGHKDGYAAGCAEQEAAAKKSQGPAPQKTPQKPAPAGFGPLKLGMTRMDAHLAVSSWNLRDVAGRAAFVRWEGMPIKDVWRFGVLFSDQCDLWSVTDGNVGRLARPEEIPADCRDARLIAITVNYFNDHSSGSDQVVSDAFRERLHALYGKYFSWHGQGGMWYWSAEDRFAQWNKTLMQFTIGMGEFAQRVVKTATESAERLWRHRQTQQALADLNTALQEIPESAPGGQTAPSQERPVDAKEVCGSWRVWGFDSESGRFEGFLVLKRSEGPGEIAGELVWTKGPFERPGLRRRVRGSVHNECFLLPGSDATYEGWFRVLTLFTDVFPGDDRSSVHPPPLIYAAVLEKDNELRWGSTSWSSNERTFWWEAKRTKVKEWDEGLLQRSPNVDALSETPA